MKPIYVDDDNARRMWWASLEVIQKNFYLTVPKWGVWVASPLPSLKDKKFSQITRLAIRSRRFSIFSKRKYRSFTVK